MSCSVVRRVALPDAFFAIDGAIETTLTVLDGFGAYEYAIQRELEHYLPFLATTRILMGAVKAGAGREEAHEVIKEHAVAAALSVRETASGENDLLARLASDQRLPLEEHEIQAILQDPEVFIGLADAQILDFLSSVTKINSKYPGVGSYRPSPIL